MLKIIEDEKGWQNVIHEMPSRDFYHTYDYHHIAKKDDETPLLIYYKTKDLTIAIPFLLRSIPNSQYFDLTSVYGYAGPLCKGRFENFDNNHFRKQFLDYLHNNKIVSVFSRLNPFITGQDIILQGLGNVMNLGLIVNIDLSLDVIEQERSISKTTNRYLRKVRKSCYTIVSDKPEDILAFQNLYYETMKRVEANDFYYFNEEYFMKFIKSKEFKTDLILAKLKETDEIIAGALMIKANNIVQYHLSGTKTEYLRHTPLRLLIDDTRIRASQEGYTFFNLGGGHGSQEDSLFFFKSSFSKDFRQFTVWKFIVDQEVYDELVSRNTNLNKIEDPDNCMYFPLYRYE